MTKTETNQRNAFDVFQAGAWKDLTQYSFERPTFTLEGKLFLGERLHLSGGEISLNRMPAGTGMPFFHAHKSNEEVYIFVGGEGEMQIDDELFPVQEGTTVRVSSAPGRIWRNTGTTDLYFVCVQYREGAPADREGNDAHGVDRPLPW